MTFSNKKDFTYSEQGKWIDNWIELCWYDERPIHPSTGEEVCKYDMIRSAKRVDEDVEAALIATQCADDKDIAAEEFKDSLFRFWVFELQAHAECIEQLILEEQEEARQDERIDRFQDYAA